MEFAVLWQGRGLVPGFSVLHELRAGAVLKGRSLDPMPPKASKHAEVRYLDIREDDDLDEDQLRSWIKQAAALPGEMM